MVGAAVKRRILTAPRSGVKKARVDAPSRALSTMPMFTTRRFGNFTGGDWYMGPTSAWNSLVLDFKLNYLSNFAQFTSMFEQYRVNWVKYHFIPSAPNMKDTDAWSGPTVYTTTDYDGETDVTTLAKMQSYSGAKLVSNPFRKFTLTIKPHAQILAGNSLTATGARPVPSPWLDSNAPGIVHYGGAIGGMLNSFALSNTSSFGYTVVCEASVSFKGTKAP